MESASSEKPGKTEPSPKIRATLQLVCHQQSIRFAVQGAAIAKPSTAPSIWDPASDRGPQHSGQPQKYIAECQWRQSVSVITSDPRDKISIARLTGMFSSFYYTHL